jgi:hypothetical protein
MSALPFKKIVLGAVLFILAVAIGFFLGRYSLKSLPYSSSNSNFSSQTATLNGVVTDISGGNITTKNNNELQTFPLSANVTIYAITPGRQAKTSTDLKTVEVGKEASLRLDYISNKYQVTSISYLVK